MYPVERNHTPPHLAPRKSIAVPACRERARHQTAGGAGSRGGSYLSEHSLADGVRKTGGATMTIAGSAAFMGMLVLSLLAQSTPASAQADCKALVAPSPFGPDDQTGATNRVTAAVTKAAAAEIQTGIVTPMAFNLTDSVPLFGTRFSKTILTSFATMPGAEFGNNKLSYMEDTYLSQSHVGTHIDGVGHIGVQDCYYNQTPMGKYVTQNYLKRLGLENLKTFATRGVIIDAVKVLQAAGKLKTNPACKNPCLDAGTLITETDLQAGLKMYNVTLREGDAVFIHTGWGDLFQQYPAQNATYNSGQPGITNSAAVWLASQKVVVVGSDNWAVEVIPGENKDIAFPVHKTLITDNGIHIIENVRTDLISAAAASSKRATFFLSMTVPKAVGLAARTLPVDMSYFDNAGDPARAVANAEAAIAAKVDLLIEYHADADANAEIARRLADAGIPLLALVD